MSRLRKALIAVMCAMSLQAQAAGDSVPSRAPALDTGTIGEAPYRMEVPAHWNGELVVLAQGFEPVGTPRPTPMPQNEAAPLFLSAGYAVAQSGYSSQGWAVREAVEDLERLRQRFVQSHGAVRRTYLVGFSMGGGIAAATLEKHPDGYNGALSLCGANLPGTRLAEELFTTLVAFDYFFPAATPDAGLSTLTSSASEQGQVMSTIAGALAAKPEAAARMARYLEVPADAVPGVVSLHYLVFQDIARRAGGQPVDNRKTVYSGFGDDKAFNAGVRRHGADPQAMRYVASAPALSGHPDKPLVVRHNHDDPTITPRFQSVFAELAGTAKKPKPLLLPSVGEGHCGFSGEQIKASFQTLVDWVDSGRRPAAD